MKTVARLGMVMLALPLFGAVAPRVAMAQATSLVDFGAGSVGGTNPQAVLTNVNGVLYGTTQYGGTGYAGTLFSYTPGGTLSTLANFGVGPVTGSNPIADLTDLNGTLYGTTSSDVSAFAGTLFSYDPTTTTFTTLASFGTGTLSGRNPDAGLTNVGGTLYGTTSGGGSNSDGTLFSFDPVAKTFTTLASFGTTTATGQRPTADLINVNGTLYGTTSIGGSATHGTLFSYNPATTTFTTLASFGTGALSGLSPDASVIDVNGMLYGTTEKGGSSSGGTLFSYDLATHATATLVDLGAGANAATNPYAGLTDVNGTLYGTEGFNGANGGGALFSYDPGRGTFTTLASFASGAEPLAGVTDLNGALYGTTYNGGSAGGGSLYSYTLPASPVPEPSSVLVALAGIAGLATLRRRRV